MSAARGSRHRTGTARPMVRDEVERLRHAAKNPDLEPGQGLFDSTSATWRINREAVLLAGGGRALLLQIAHPLVAAGVARHSTFETDPLGRLQRTLDLTLTIIFASAGEALRAVQTIEALHARVRGELSESVGPFARGTTYDANAAELQFWVHATLVETAMSTYERFVAPLSRDQRAAFYEESKTTARLFAIPDELIPPDLAAFEDYWQDQLAGDQLVLGEDGRRVAAAIVDPPLPPVLRQLAGSGRVLSEGLLPAGMRRRFGVEWTDARARRLALAEAFARRTLPLLPARARYFPQAVAAMRRNRTS